MTRDEFMVELSKLPKKGWKVRMDQGGAIRLKSPKWFDNNITYCPLTAVTRATTKYKFYINEVNLAAFELNLDNDIIFNIMYCADSKEAEKILGINLRSEMLAALNLEEN